MESYRPLKHNKDGLLGPNSIMVVYEEPLSLKAGPMVSHRALSK